MAAGRSSIDNRFASFNGVAGVEIDGKLSLAAMVIGPFRVVAATAMRATTTKNQIVAAPYFPFGSELDIDRLSLRLIRKASWLRSRVVLGFVRTSLSAQEFPALGGLL
jgi:hypothetical protein